LSFHLGRQKRLLVVRVQPREAALLRRRRCREVAFRRRRRLLLREAHRVLIRRRACMPSCVNVKQRS
jgi:hypothetical protein